MPELPEVETIRRGLAQSLPGRRIDKVVLHRPDICIATGGGICRPVALLQGGVVQALERCGKQLAIVAEGGRALVVHLGMSGQLRLVANRQQAPADHVHASWQIEGGQVLVFRDPRRFGGLWALRSTAELQARWALLGPDALGITGEHLATAVGRSKRAIKAALLDQQVVAGIGNIYADEALFRARLRPDRLCTTLRAGDYRRLASAIHEALTLAIDAGGSTLRDYTSATGEAGRAQQGHLVYGREGAPCPKCRRPLEGSTVAQRSTVLCPRCQR